MPTALTELENIIIKYEGLALEPYVDTVGKTTIGVGRNLTDNGITKEEALYLMRNDIIRCQKELSCYSWYLSQPKSVQYALINMCFNLGIERLLGFRKMIEALIYKDYTKAAMEALNSTWASQVGQRAKDVALMIRQAS